MNIKKWHILGMVVLSIAGTFWHFGMKVFPENSPMRFLFPVNESVWEHLKLVFWPSLFFMLIEYCAYGKDIEGFFATKVLSVSLAMAFIVCFFYTYSGILGRNYLPVDIGSFYIAVVIYTMTAMCIFMYGDFFDGESSVKAIFIYLIFISVFIVWTDTPPSLGMFGKM